MSYKVYGYIKSADTELDIKGLRVKAWDMDIKYHDLLGDDVTDENGYFEINFTKADFSPGGWRDFLEGGPDIKIEVFDTGGNLIHTSDKIQGAGVITDLGDIQIGLAEEFIEQEEETEQESKPETLETCYYDPIPPGYIMVGRITSLTKCRIGLPPGFTYPGNVLEVKRYEHLPVGETMWVCGVAPVPDGWAIINYDTDSTKCNGGMYIYDNVKQIIKVNSKDPEPTPTITTLQICGSTPIPEGFIWVSNSTDFTRCGGGFYIKGNVVEVRRYDHLPIGETMWVCGGAPLPDGWEKTGNYRTDPSTCGGGMYILNNIKEIQKTGTAKAVSTPIRVSNVQITNIMYDGLVPRVESDEYVEITNLGTEPQDLAGWVLKDTAEGYPSFTFPQSVLKPRETIRVYTNEIHILWGGFSFGYGRAIWNNKEPDTAALYNAQGEEVSRRSYEV